MRKGNYYWGLVCTQTHTHTLPKTATSAIKATISKNVDNNNNSGRSNDVAVVVVVVVIVGRK